MLPKVIKAESINPPLDHLALHEMACKHVVENYQREGLTEPTWIIAAGSKVGWIETPFTDPVVSKEMAVAAVRTMLENTQAQAYSFICETWRAVFNVETMGKEEVDKWLAFTKQHSVSELPEHLREDAAVVMSFSRDGSQAASVYKVSDGKLGERHDEDMKEMTGRMASLFKEPSADRPMIYEMLHPQATIDMLGYLPEFISPHDPRDAVSQFDDRYVGGWNDMPNFTLDTKDDLTLRYPDDPPYRPLAKTRIRGETIIFYQHGITVVLQKDGTFRAARLD